jgi:hypothetical protein
MDRNREPGSPVGLTKETTMGDDKTFTNPEERKHAAGDDAFKVRHIAERHGIPLETARDLLHRLGDDPAKLEREIHRLKSSG